VLHSFSFGDGASRKGTLRPMARGTSMAPRVSGGSNDCGVVYKMRNTGGFHRAAITSRAHLMVTCQAPWCWTRRETYTAAHPRGATPQPVPLLAAAYSLKWPPAGRRPYCTPSTTLTVRFQMSSCSTPRATCGVRPQAEEPRSRNDFQNHHQRNLYQRVQLRRRVERRGALRRAG
jgi:hypothetical protein